MFSKKETAKIFGFFLISVLMFSVLSGIVGAQITAEDSDNSVTDADIADLKRAVEGLEEMKSGLDDLKSQVPGSSGGTTDQVNIQANSVIIQVTQQISSVLDSAATGVQPIAQFFLGKIDPQGTASTLGPGEWMLVKFLLFLLVFAIAFYALKKTPAVQDYSWLVWLIAFVVALITARYLGTQALVNFAGLPSAMLGISFLCIFPFIVYLFFIESFDSDVIRKVGWIVFAVIYFGLAIYQWDILATKAYQGATPFNLAWLYVVIGIASLLALYFDKNIQAYFFLSFLRSQRKTNALPKVTELRKEVEKWEGVIIDPSVSDADKAKAQKKIDEFEKSIVRLMTGK